MIASGFGVLLNQTGNGGALFHRAEYLGVRNPKRKLVAVCLIEKNSSFTDAEAQAIKAVQEHFAATGSIPSARVLSRALGYRSSRFGHLLLQRLLNRGNLIRRGNSLALGQKVVLE
jgi:hypothetical protein